MSCGIVLYAWTGMSTRPSSTLSCSTEWIFMFLFDAVRVSYFSHVSRLAGCLAYATFHPRWLATLWTEATSRETNLCTNTGSEPVTIRSSLHWWQRSVLHHRRLFLLRFYLCISSTPSHLSVSFNIYFLTPSLFAFPSFFLSSLSVLISFFHFIFFLSFRLLLCSSFLTLSLFVSSFPAFAFIYFPFILFFLLLLYQKNWN